MALRPQRINKKETICYKGKKPFDLAKCRRYNWDEFGHMYSDCKVKSAQTEHVEKIADKARKYINKQFKLKNKGSQSHTQKTEKALYAEDWLDEELSYDDEEEMGKKCLMAIT